MRRKVSNGHGDADWQEMGPCAPIPCGPGGVRHTHGAPRDPLDWEPAQLGTVIPEKGHQPFQMKPFASIEVTYGD